jgi:glycosyltransferase involved in cell wall biosynthesis
MPMPPSRVLFVHDHYPGQFGGLARWLAGRGWDVGFATAHPPERDDGFRILPWRPHRPPSPATHPYAQPMDRAALNAQAVVRAALGARRAGFRPEVIVAHSGRGAGMFARDVFPDAAFVAYCEWWYRFPGVDVAYLAELGVVPPSGDIEAPMHERARNTPIVMDLAAADAAVCPTRFQAAQFPVVLQRALTVLHDGVDTARFRPDPSLAGATLGGLVAADAKLVTYATRGMEPHRGFPQFVAALPAILAADPAIVAVIAGENRVAYGGDALRGIDWRAAALAEHRIDPGRVRFVGTLDPDAYLRLLQRSDAHVYLTVPFVLSWSMLEAMSTACPLVLSDTAPVREFADASMAALADLARPETIAQAVLATLAGGPAVAVRRARARAAVEARLDAAERFAAWERLLVAVVRDRAKRQGTDARR